MTIQQDGGSNIPPWTMGDRLRKARELQGLGQQQFADRIGVSRATVTNAERGHHGVREITINAWAIATGVPREWLRDGVVSATDDDGPRPGGPGGDQVRPRGDSNTRHSV